MSQRTDLSVGRSNLRAALRDLDDALVDRNRTDAIAEANRRSGLALSPTTVGGWFEKGIPAKNFPTLWAVVEVLLEWSGHPRPDTLSGPARAKAVGWWTGTKELWKTRWENARTPGAHISPGVAYVGRPIAEFDDRLVLDDLGVHSALDAGVAIAGIGELPAYVTREFDARLGSVVAAAMGGHSGIAVLVGGSSAGKTRACWEAVKNLPDGWRLWHPIDRPTAVIRDLDRVAPRTVVWLDDAQHYLLDPDHSMEVARGLGSLLREPERGPVLVLGTIWREYWEKLFEVATAPDPQDVYAKARQLVAGKSIPVREVFTVEELQAARAAATSDPRLAEALKHAEQGHVTQYLAGAPTLIERYNNASPGAKALIDAAMDVRALGHGLALPLALLQAAAEGYLTDTQWDLLADDWLDQALARISSPQRGTRGPLTRINPRAGQGALAQPHYRLADYLEQHSGQFRHGDRVPAATWDALVRHAAPTDRARLATAAWDRGLLRIAMRLYTAAAADDDADGADRREVWRLASVLLKDAGRTEEWRTWHRRAVAADDDHAVYTEAQILREARGVDAALAWLRGAVETGSRAAVRATARMLEEEGRLEEALAWYLRGAETGTALAGYVARTLQKLDRMDEALPWYRKAIEQGDSGSSQQVARKLDSAGRREEALVWYLRAVDELGGFLFLGRAAELMEKSQGAEAALAWLGERADAGDTFALGAAASLLMDAGQDKAASAWLRERAEAGDAGALREIAVILKRAGQEAEALTHYDRAARAGDKLALMWGAEMLKLKGQQAEALAWYERAADAGDTYAPSHAARILREAGRVEEALTWYERGASASPGELSKAASMLRDAGRRAQALAWYRRAADAGDRDALRSTAILLDEMGRVEEAAKLTRYGWEPDGKIAEPWEVVEDDALA